MPIRQTGIGPGIAQPTPTYDFGDPFAGAGSVQRVASLPRISSIVESGFAPGAVSGGFSYENVLSMSDVRKTSDFMPNLAPLTVPASLLSHPFGTGVRTGSFEVNMLDMGGTLSMLTGSTIGRADPLMGDYSGSQDVLSRAMELAGNYMSLPSRILDYGIATPVVLAKHAFGWSNAPTSQPKNPDGSDYYAFHSDQRYWDVIVNGSDAQILEMAQLAASAQVAPALQKAYAAQLHEVFRRDRDAQTGLSSGNERIDYANKKNLGYILAMGKAGAALNGGVTLQDLADPAKVGTILYGSLNSAARSIIGFLPVGTQILQATNPVTAEEEAAWVAIGADLRRNITGVTSAQAMIADIGATWPLFSGVGTFMAAAKGGMLGARFVETGMAARIMRISDSYALSFGLPTIATPELTAAARVGASLGRGGKNIYDAYEGGLYAMRMSLTASLPLMLTNWALESVSPEYAKTIGAEIDASHYVSESALAGALNMAGLFSGGTFGATTLFKMTKGAVTKVSGAPVFNGLQHDFLGGMGGLDVTARSVGFSDGMAFDRSFKNLTFSLLQNYVRSLTVEGISRLPEGAEQIARLERYDAHAETMVNRFGNALLIARDESKLWGFETPKVVEARTASARAGRELVDGITKGLKRERVSHWQEELRKLNMPYTKEGFSSYIGHVAESMGWKFDAKMMESANKGDLAKWERSANAIEMHAFDVKMGEFKAIQDGEAGKLISSAQDMTIVRQGATDGLVGDRYVEVFDSKVDASDAAAVEAKATAIADLRARLIDTFKVRETWVKMRPTGEGPRSLEAMTDRQLYDIIKQIRPVLGHTRVLPDRATVGVDDTLNRFHLDLYDQGIWDLQYIPTMETTEAAAKASYEAALHAAYEGPVEYAAAKATVFREYSDARNNADIYKGRLHDQLYDTYIKPIEEGPLGDQMRVADRAVASASQDMWEALNFRAMGKLENPALIKKTTEVVVKLNKAFAAIQKRYMKAMDAANAKRTAATQADPTLTSLVAKEDAAYKAWTGFALNNPPPLVLRIGPYAPKDFIHDPFELGSARPEMNDYIEAHVDVGPDGRPGFWHATTRLREIADWVKGVGLRNREELSQSGQPAAGTGGGSRATESSTTVSYIHALAWEARLKMMARIMEGKSGLSDVFDHFYKEYPHEYNFEDPVWVGKQLDYRIENHLEDFALKGGFERDAPEVWDELYSYLLANPETVSIYAHGSIPAAELEGRIAARVLQSLDRRLDQTEGHQVLITDDPWEKFQGVLTEDNVGIVRVAVDPRAESGIKEGADTWGGEIALKTTHTFVYQDIPGNPFESAVPDATAYWGDVRMNRKVSFVKVYDPQTATSHTVASDFFEHPTNAETVGLSNRRWVAAKYDELFRGWRSWKMNEAMRSQATRLIAERYEGVLPEAAEAFVGRVLNMAYEKWSPVPRGLAKVVHGNKLTKALGIKGDFASALGPQAVAKLRATDVNEIGGQIFGHVETGRFDVKGNKVMEPAQYMNRATGQMETPDWAGILATGFQQGWKMNFTSGLTSRLKNAGAFGVAASLTADWLIPVLRYAASPVFKVSELVESKMFNKMAGAPRTSDELRAAFREMGVNQHGTLDEAFSDDMMRALSNSLLPDAASVNAAFARGLGDLTTGPDALVANFLDHARTQAANPSLSAKARAAWKSVLDPTPFKDGLANDLAIKYIGDDFAGLLRKWDPQTYKVLRNELKVPDARMAEFIAEDRWLYQQWQDGTVSMQDLMGHSTKFNPSQAEQMTPALEAFYASPEYAGLEGMLRLSSKAAQVEAFGVHYFGSYRSSFERSLNHPVLGVYPASWAIKAGREWFKFLFENRTFGGGALHLGAAPAAFLQQIAHQQAKWFAQNNDMSLADWMFKSPLSRWFFMFNLLLPGDWSNIPFPASRSIKDLLRGKFNPVEIATDAMVGPESRGGIGVIRDFNLARLGVQDTIDAFSTHHQDTPWDKLILGLDSAGNSPLPVDFEKLTRYQERTLTPP